jgi:hypothetical protein
MPLYGPLSPEEAAPLHSSPLPEFTRGNIDYESFCAGYPFRVVGPEDQPERRFSTLACAARTVLSAGPRFHIECGLFRASYAQCGQVVADADFAGQLEDAREKSKYREKIKEPK